MRHIAMEDYREQNIREIQKILDSCIAQEYRKKVHALDLKQEYLTKEQMKEYLRQEVFHITETLVVMHQNCRALCYIRTDMYIPDFLWESCFFEDLSSDEKRKYIAFQCADFSMEEYSKQPTCYDERLPYFSYIVRFVVDTKYLEYLQQQEKQYAPLMEHPIQPKEEKEIATSVKVVGKANPFKSVLTPQQIELVTTCINEVHIFTTTITPNILQSFFECTLDGALKSNNNRLLAYLMMKLSNYDFITYEWQSAIANNKLVLAKIKNSYLTRSDLSTANDNIKYIDPKGSEIIDKYINQLKKG